MLNSSSIGDYLVLETLGKGSFFKVKRGVNKKNNQVKALKFIK